MERLVACRAEAAAAAEWTVQAENAPRSQHRTDQCEHPAHGRVAHNMRRIGGENGVVHASGHACGQDVEFEWGQDGPEVCLLDPCPDPVVRLHEVARLPCYARQRGSERHRVLGGARPYLEHRRAIAKLVSQHAENRRGIARGCRRVRPDH